MSVYGNGGGDYGGSMPAGAAYAPAPQQPKVRFDIIGEAWGLFQKEMGTWVLSTLILLVLVFSISFVLSFTGTLMGLSTTGRDGQPRFNPGSVSFSLFSSLITNAVSYFLMGGLYRMALKQLRGQSISVGDVFSGGDVFVSLFLTMLLYMISVFGGSLLCVVPGLLVGGLMMLAPIIIADKREASPIQALKMSWNALRPEMLMATLFMFVLSLVSGLGAIGCGVGILFTYPLYFIGQAILYRDFFGLGEDQTYEPGHVGPQNPWASR